MPEFEQGLSKLRLLFEKLKLKVLRKNRMKKAMEIAIKEGRRRAQALAPVLTGWLRSNIEENVYFADDETVHGSLFMDLNIVPYGRRQEYEHITKGFFMLRGTEYAIHVLENLVGDGDFIEAVLFNEKGQ